MSNKKLLPIKYSSDDILSTLIESNIVDADGVQLIMKKKQLEFILSRHEYKIWQGKDGRWKTYLPNEERPYGRRQISRESRDAIENLLYEYYLEEDKDFLRRNISMEYLYDEWADYKKLYVSGSTLKRDRSTWNSFYKDTEIVRKPMSSISKDELERWIVGVVRDSNMNKHQYNNFAGVARQMFTYAYEQGIIDQNPMDRVHIRNKRLLKPEPKKSGDTEVFSREERKLLIEKAYEHYESQKGSVQRFTPLAIAFLFYVSLRRGELVALRFEDLEGSRLILKDSYSHDMSCLKGRLKDADGWRVVDVPEPALGIIEKIRDERKRLGMPTDDFIFTVDGKLESMYCSLGRAIKTYCDELGIPRRSIHKTRKTCASMMHAAGIDDLTIQAQLGHQDIKTTYKSYCYDISTDIERYNAISMAMTEVVPRGNPSNHIQPSPIKQ